MNPFLFISTCVLHPTRNEFWEHLISHYHCNRIQHRNFIRCCIPTAACPESPEKIAGSGRLLYHCGMGQSLHLPASGEAFLNIDIGFYDRQRCCIPFRYVRNSNWFSEVGMPVKSFSERIWKWKAYECSWADGPRQVPPGLKNYQRSRTHC